MMGGRDYKNKVFKKEVNKDKWSHFDDIITCTVVLFYEKKLEMKEKINSKLMKII
jgi:hypothetical protein